MNSFRYFLKERLPYFTWAWFTLPMSAGGISSIISVLPHRFEGLEIIGLIFFFFDFIVFFLLVILMIMRYTLTHAKFKRTLHHPVESLFIPTAFLAFITIVNGICQYAVPKTGQWAIDLVRVLFWIYTATVTIQAVYQYYVMFSSISHLTHHAPRSMTPGWLLPIFPSMLVGTAANSIAKLQSQQHGLNIAIAGLAFQGLGFLFSMLMFAILVRRLMQYGLPEGHARPGLFIGVGPPAFTSLVLLGLARESRSFLPPNFSTTVDTAEVLIIMGTVASILLWQLSAFFWLLAALATFQYWREGELHFALSWYASIFPVSGWVISTLFIGEALKSKAIGWVGTGMAIYLILLFLFVFVNHIVALYKGSIMVEDKGEDKKMRLSDLEDFFEDARYSGKKKMKITVGYESNGEATHGFDGDRTRVNTPAQTQVDLNKGVILEAVQVESSQS